MTHDLDAYLPTSAPTLLLLLGLAACAAGCSSEEDLGDNVGDTDGEGESTGSASTTADAETETDASSTSAGSGEEASTGTGMDISVPVGCGPVVPVDETAGAEWIFQCGSVGHDRLREMEVSDTDDIYISVEFQPTTSPLALPPELEFDNEVYTNAGRVDAVVAQLDDAGEVQWSRHLGTGTHDGVNGMAACPDGVIVAGFTEAGSTQLGGEPLEHPDFLAKFDTDGQHVWSRSFELFGDDAHVSLHSLDCGSGGLVVATGSMRDGADFGGGRVDAGSEDGFVAVFEPDGTHRWSRSLLGSDAEDGFPAARGAWIKIAPNGDLVVLGSFSANLSFGGDPLIAEGDDVFVARLDPSGSEVWSRAFVSPSYKYSTGLTVDESGLIGVTGIFFEHIVIGGERWDNVLPELDEEKHGTTYDVFVVALNADGTVAWKQHDGTMLDDDVAGQTVVTPSEIVAARKTSEGFHLSSYDDAAGPVEFLDVPGFVTGLGVVAGEIAMSLEFSQDIDLLGVRLRSAGEEDVALVKLR